jgi:hypothetical protein
VQAANKRTRRIGLLRVWLTAPSAPVAARPPIVLLLASTGLSTLPLGALSVGTVVWVIHAGPPDVAGGFVCVVLFSVVVLLLAVRSAGVTRGLLIGHGEAFGNAIWLARMVAFVPGSVVVRGGSRIGAGDSETSSVATVLHRSEQVLYVPGPGVRAWASRQHQEVRHGARCDGAECQGDARAGGDGVAGSAGRGARVPIVVGRRARGAAPMMRALVYDPAVAGGLRLASVAEPEPRPGQVLVDVEAIALNFGEVVFHHGRPLGSVVGWDAAGTVAAGELVGRRVVTFTCWTTAGSCRASGWPPERQPPSTSRRPGSPAPGSASSPSRSAASGLAQTWPIWWDCLAPES